MQDNEKEVQINGEFEAQNDSSNRVYELGYLLVPNIAEEEVPAVFGNLKELVSSFGGVHISDEMPKMIPLAYSMVKVVSNVRSKWSNAYFGWIKFNMDSNKVLEMKKKLDLDPNVIRFLILKTVKENTIASKRFVRSDHNKKTKTEKSETDENAVPITKEEMDKEIDALIAV